LPRSIRQYQEAVIINVSRGGHYTDPNCFRFIKSFNLSESLQDELMGMGVRVQVLCPGFTLTEFHDTPQYSRFNRDSIPRFLWMSSEQVVVESLKALEGHKVICIPGNFYKIVGVFARNSFTAGLIKTATRYVLHRRKRR
jgi:short-subunit dehydrogenase